MRQDNPAELMRDALHRWYMRSPEEIEAARQTAAEARYAEFFGTTPSTETPGGAAMAAKPFQHLPNDPRRGLNTPAKEVGQRGSISRLASPREWQRDELSAGGRFPRPVPLPSPWLGPDHKWSRPVPLLPVQLPAGGARPIPFAPAYPDTSTQSAFAGRTAKAPQPLPDRPSAIPELGGGDRPRPNALPQQLQTATASFRPNKLNPSNVEVIPGSSSRSRTVEVGQPNTFAFANINSPVGARVGQPTSTVDTSILARSHRTTPVARGRTYRPVTPPMPSFLSGLFGGPAPLTSPGGHVIGYYDHAAGKAAMHMTAGYAEIAPLFHPAGWMEVVGTKASTPLLQAIDDGILEALQRHHPVPLHMGGVGCRIWHHSAPASTPKSTACFGPHSRRLAFRSSGVSEDLKTYGFSISRTTPTAIVRL